MPRATITFVAGHAQDAELGPADLRMDAAASAAARAGKDVFSADDLSEIKRASFATHSRLTAKTRIG